MGADRSVPQQYHYDSVSGKSEASGSAYSGGDGDFITSGSLTLNDGDHITDSGGDNRITFTNAGSLILKDEAGNAGLTVDASQNVNLENGKILSVDTINEKASNAGVTIEGILLKDGKLNSTGTVTSRVDDTAGDGTSAIHATSTDVAGRITFSDTWANADTCTVSFAAAYGTAPKVILGYNASVNAGITATTTGGFVITATGTCAGFVDYMVVESV